MLYYSCSLIINVLFLIHPPQIFLALVPTLTLTHIDPVYITWLNDEIIYDVQEMQV